MSKANPDDLNPAGVSPENYRAVFEQIKSLYATNGSKLTGNETLSEAKKIIYRPSGGRVLSARESLDMLVRAAHLGIYSGSPIRLKPKGNGRGPRCKDDQYDRMVARAWHWINSFVRSERSRNTVHRATDAARTKAQTQRDKITRYRARISPRISRAKVVQAILYEFEREGVEPPSARTIRRAIASRKTLK
jgi:hypothetical protein